MPLLSMSPSFLPAAQYLRMSTEHQQYSTANQADAIARYANAHGMEVVKTYLDAGKSGLRLESRPGLKELLGDVQNGRAAYSVILVYDVSRWGRFQDGDESAYYEHLCKRAKVRVHYCVEAFENDGSMASTLMKSIKRIMAGAYSRELSAKVFAGQFRIAGMGFHQGGKPGLGLRRLLVNREREAKGLLKQGECKSLQTDHIILVPGPDKEVQLVQHIFNAFSEEGKSTVEIARSLNARGFTTLSGGPWEQWHIYELLTKPKYAGVSAWNRRSFKVGSNVSVLNPPDMRVWRENAFAPLITLEQFQKVQSILHRTALHYTEEGLLDHLRRILKNAGELSYRVINSQEDGPCTNTYRRHFGRVRDAYKIIGYTPSRKSRFDIVQAIKEKHSEHLAKVVQMLRDNGAIVEQHPKTGTLTINHEFTMRLILVLCTETPAGYRWIIRIAALGGMSVVVVARLRPGNQEILDYYILPNVAKETELRLGALNCPFERYRFNNLNILTSSARRAVLREVA